MAFSGAVANGTPTRITPAKSAPPAVPMPPTTTSRTIGRPMKKSKFGAATPPSAAA